jgi:ubiquinone/menaquinone biosynthesis C-methylase UbiE
MRKFRRFYYDIFSHFYDFFIQLHSMDKSSELRGFLIKKTGIGHEDRVLDICTGTGPVIMAAHKVIAPKGFVVGMDFSYGMLRKARDKAKKKGLSSLYLVMGDVSEMPFKENIFECVTCSHSMYELKSEARMKALNEICRVLKENGRFFMMEHRKPSKPFIRFLYYVRLMCMGSPENRRFAENEVPMIKRFLKDVKKEFSPSGKSKLISGVKYFQK